MLKTIIGGLADGEGGALNSYQSLVNELVDATLVGFPSLHEEAAEDMKTAELVDLLWTGYPLVCLLSSERQMLVEVHGGLLGYLNGVGLFHPDVGDFGQHLFRWHEHGGQNLTLAYIFFPKGDGKGVEV